MDSIAEYIKEERDVLYLRGLDKGHEQARQEEKTRFITFLIQEGSRTFDQIANIAGATVDFVKSVHRQLAEK